MIALSWMLFALLALSWTAAAWFVAAAAEWTAQALASGSASQAARELATRSLPEWLPATIGSEWLHALQSVARWVTEAASTGLPLLGTAAGWLVPAIWMAWGLGMLLILLLAVGAHVLMRRLGRRGGGPGPARLPHLTAQRYGHDPGRNPRRPDGEPAKWRSFRCR